MPSIEPPPGFWVRESGHAPLPVTPLTRPFWQHRKWLRVVAGEMGFLFDTLDVQEIGGWLYLRVVPLVDKVGTPPPASLVPDLYTTIPKLRQRVHAGITAVRTDVAGELVCRWRDRWRAELSQRIAALQNVDLEALTDDELAKHYESALALSDDGSQIHFRLWGAVVVALGMFDATCRELLGWDVGRSIELLAGTSTSSTEPALALESVRTEADFAEYVQRFGHRALTYDLADPTLAERPEVLHDLVRDRRAHDPAKARARAGQLLNQVPRSQRFDEDYARALAAYPVREENEVLTISTPLALLRIAALVAGRRLAERGQLDETDDVFFLEVSELLAALRDGDDQRAEARRRRGERAWALANPGPATYGAPAPPLPMDTLPKAARQVNEAFWWALDQIAAPAGNTRTHVTGSVTITGVPASAGKYGGPVRVIRDGNDFDKLRAGDVVVCPVLPPVWSVLLGSAGALVTDQGGPLSHSAIIAREFGIPAVVATGDATSQVRDGQIVTVDGSGGTVHLSTK
ncbi:PEP-utilizing enzyme [Kibdelosporangium aridum]|uniref:PEP-utilising enzyme, mobile domain n=2 Tax=Kibdelosporangium aridum TaxID=2030 RepID=A0A1W1ZS51_KIBAR|nr:PEP-utilizing enzyme [Kibdelosporangium aridum]SMC51042.1 PEP-utilising enzyme, mobile domain [Kibdelosporangium aridum]